MSEASKAVFLSYAREDTDAAIRIAEALRSQRVEVWFDQNELVGGDAWDAKIRKQIASCALFVPVISANTQARLEGYFRIEWKLAAQRTHAMAEAKPFLLPVVIDATRDAEAHVPGEFRSLQWTQLPGGETPAKFCERVRKLLGVDSGIESGRPRPGERGPFDGLRVPSLSRDEGAASPGKIRATPKPVGRALRARPWWLGGAVAALILGATGWRLWHRDPPFVPPAARRSAPPTSEKTVPVTEARQLTLKARALIDDDLMAVRENFRLAEELCQKAVGLDNTDAEAWATWARVSVEMIRRTYGAYDMSSQRRESARAQAERAIRLAPASVEAGLAMASYVATTGGTAENERRLRDLLGRAPMDARVALALAAELQALGQDTEATEIRLKHPAFAGNDPRPLIDEVRQLRRKGRFVEAEALVDRAQALAPTPPGYIHKFLILGFEWGDLEAARLYLEKVPPQLLVEDAFASLAAQVWIRLGQGEKAMSVLRRVPRDFFEEGYQVLPKGFLTGWALRIAGRPTAAEAEWKQALAVVGSRLAAEPNQAALLRWKALLLALTGQKAEAEKNHTLALELLGHSPDANDAAFYLALGRTEEAIRALQTGRGGPRSGRLNSVRYDPWFEPVRKDPRVQQVIAEGEAWLKALRQAGANPPGAKSAAAPAPDPKSVERSAPNVERSASGGHAVFLN